MNLLLKNRELDIKKAASLAHWLIEKQGLMAKQAYIIAQRKYKLSPFNRGEISKERQKLKPEQLKI